MNTTVSQTTSRIDISRSGPKNNCAPIASFLKAMSSRYIILPQFYHSYQTQWKLDSTTVYITNDIVRPSNSKMCVKEPPYNETSLQLTYFGPSLYRGSVECDVNPFKNFAVIKPPFEVLRLYECRLLRVCLFIRQAFKNCDPFKKFLNIRIVEFVTLAIKSLNWFTLSGWYRETRDEMNARNFNSVVRCIEEHKLVEPLKILDNLLVNREQMRNNKIPKIWFH